MSHHWNRYIVIWRFQQTRQNKKITFLDSFSRYRMEHIRKVIEQDKELAFLDEDTKFYKNFIYCIRKHEDAIQLVFAHLNIIAWNKYSNFLFKYYNTRAKLKTKSLLNIFCFNKIRQLLGDYLQKRALHRSRLDGVDDKSVSSTMGLYQLCSMCVN